jgi:methyl-accepting chemotaxis protein
VRRRPKIRRQESVAKSNDGKSKVDEVAVAMRAATEESDKVKMLVDEVNQGSQEQARGIEQISKAIMQMEQVTQTTAANAEQSAAAAEELNAQSETLKNVVERLTAMVGGASAITGSARRRDESLQACGSPHRYIAAAKTRESRAAACRPQCEQGYVLSKRSSRNC